MKTEPTKKCCICGLDIQPAGDWLEGHNAEPAATGRCCDECNATVVIPTRLAAFSRAVGVIRGAIEQIEATLRMFDPSDPGDAAAMRRMILLERMAKKLEAQS